MKIVFSNKKLEKTFKSKEILNKKLGNELSKMVMLRINQIESFQNFYLYKEMGNGKPHPLRNNNLEYSVRLNANFRLIIKPITEDYADNGLKKCNIVELKGVVDYHGSNENWKLS